INMTIPCEEFYDTLTADQQLVTVTNNHNSPLTVAVSLVDASQGSVSPTSVTLPSQASADVTVTVDSNSQTGANALAFDVLTTGSDLDVSLTRYVDVLAGPVLKREILDKTKNNHARYRILHDIDNLADFDYVEVTYENLDTGWVDTITEQSGQREGYTTYSKGGAAGDTYEITIEVFDTSGAVVLDEVIQDMTDGTNPPGNEDLGGNPNDPVLDSFDVVDTTENNNTYFDVDYAVSNTAEFKEVKVVFDNQNSNHDWSDSTEGPNSNTSGTVSYNAGGTEGDTYEITVEVYNTNDIVVDTGSTTEVADGDDIGGGNPGGGPGDPVLDSFTVTDTTLNNTTNYQVDYQVSNTADFGYVEVLFDNMSGNDWSDSTEGPNSSANGSISYSSGGTENDTFDITVKVYDSDDNYVDAGTVTDVADGSDSSWPP
ncbi:hypothetical protein PNQ92_04790, partial [Halobacterium salinarum]|uniref:hypothetical protein n=2 Tax=Halobacterium salinarum TaxID=2242 RepID=UPI002556F88F